MILMLLLVSCQFLLVVSCENKYRYCSQACPLKGILRSNAVSDINPQCKKTSFKCSDQIYCIESTPVFRFESSDSITESNQQPLIKESNQQESNQQPLIKESNQQESNQQPSFNEQPGESVNTQQYLINIYNQSDTESEGSYHVDWESITNKNLINNQSLKKQTINIDQAHNLELSSYETRFNEYLSFKEILSREKLLKFRSKVDDFLLRYLTFLLKSFKTDQESVEILYTAITLRDNITVLKNVVKLKSFNEDLNICYRINKRCKEIYNQRYKNLCEMYEDQKKVSSNKKYTSVSFKLYLLLPKAANMWKLVKMSHETTLPSISHPIS